METNSFIPGHLVTVTAYRATIEGTVMEVDGQWVRFRVDSAKMEENAPKTYVAGESHVVDFRQVKLSNRAWIRVQADIVVDLETWAAEYGIPLTEVREDVRTYLTTALSDLHPLLALRGAVK